MEGIPQMLLQVYALLDMYLNPNQAGSLKVIHLDPAVILMLSLAVFLHLVSVSFFNIDGHCLFVWRAG